MKNEKLFRTQRHEVVDGDITHEITTEVYQGYAFIKAKYKHKTEVVKVKAFRLFVKDVWVYECQAYRTLPYDFGYVSSRSGEIAYALAKIKECKSLEEIRILMADLEEDFRVALEKDAIREIKRLLGLHKQNSPVVTRNKEYKPLPQIKLPWMEE
ncbi:hypothetical protein QO179_24940 [Bacillus stercoris]|nr:hypothetical protein [Bacillus stercoris]